MVHCLTDQCALCTYSMHVQIYVLCMGRLMQNDLVVDKLV